MEEFKSEQLKLVRALKDISIKCEANSERIRYFGFDIDALAGGGYEDMEELLLPVSDEPEVMKLLASLERLPGETIEDEINRLFSVSYTVKLMETDLIKLLGDKKYSMLQSWILTLQDSLEFNHIANPATDYDTVNIAMAAREEAMCRHVKFILSQVGLDDKLVLMAHNRHLSKGLSNEYASIPGSLNAILAKVGPNFLLPTAGVRLFGRNLDIAGLCKVVYRTAIARQADAIFFIREVSPLRRE